MRSLKQSKFIWLLTSVLLFGLVAIVTAQDTTQSASTITINTIDGTNDPELRLLVTVENALQQPINGLTAEDFSALADGRNTEIVSVEELVNNDLAVSVVMVLDSSQSMFETPMIDTKAAAGILLDNLRTQDEVAVIDFDNGVRVVQPFTSDIESARSAIDGLFAGGQTRLYDAANAGVETALTANNPRRFVILLTDGNEYGELSTNPAEAAQLLAMENGIPFFVIGLGFDVNAPYLETLAANSNGEAFITPDSENLDSIFSFISGYLRSQYIVTIAPDLEPDGSTYDITLSVDDASATGQYTSQDLYPVVTLDGVPDGPITETTTISAAIDAVRGVGDLVARDRPRRQQGHDREARRHRPAPRAARDGHDRPLAGVRRRRAHRARGEALGQPAGHREAPRGAARLVGGAHARPRRARADDVRVVHERLGARRRRYATLRVARGSLQ